MSFFGYNITLPVRENQAPLYFISATMAANIAVTTLIITRLLHHQKWVSGLLGKDHGKVYQQILFMCLESAVPVILMDIIYIVCFLRPRKMGSTIPYECLVHIYASGFSTTQLASSPSVLTDNRAAFYHPPRDDGAHRRESEIEGHQSIPPHSNCIRTILGRASGLGLHRIGASFDCRHPSTT